VPAAGAEFGELAVLAPGSAGWAPDGRPGPERLAGALAARPGKVVEVDAGSSTGASVA
jgi:hypothetical protein